MATTADKAGYPIRFLPCRICIQFMKVSVHREITRQFLHSNTSKTSLTLRNERISFFLQTAFTEESCLHWEGFPIQIVIDVKLVITVMLYRFEKFRVGGACASIKHFLSASLLVTNVWAWSVAPITVHRWLRIYIRHSYKYWL